MSSWYQKMRARQVRGAELKQELRGIYQALEEGKDRSGPAGIEWQGRLLQKLNVVYAQLAYEFDPLWIVRGKCELGALWGLRDVEQCAGVTLFRSDGEWD